MACLLAVPVFSQQQITLIPISKVWKYTYVGGDLSGQFQTPGYNDASWSAGPALLGYDVSRPFPYFDPLLTEFPSSSSFPNTIYFRTHFDFPSNTLGVVLRATNYVDDGAVFYLNGHEVQRIRLPIGAVSYNTHAAVSNPEGQGNVLQFATTNLQQGDNVLAVEVHQHDTLDADVIFGMSLIAFLPEPGPVRITNQPPSRTIEEGDSTTFVAEVNGTPPYFFQWFKGTEKIDGATNNSLTLNFIGPMASGDYSFVVSNEFSSATSSNATLTITPAPYQFVRMTNMWRYHASGQNLGVSWRSTSFSDSTWSQGSALFYNTRDALPAPKGTQLPLTNASGQNIVTWYFRTHFTWVGQTSGVSLRARTLIDDGAVFYINGVEAGRLGMPGAPATIGYSTPAAYRVETLTNYTTIALTSSALVQGDNVLAVEVHQSSFEASDMVFGLALGTNFSLSLPDLMFWGPASAYTEVESFVPEECDLNEGCGTPTTRRILRFDTETRNIGQADLVLGDPANNPLYSYDACHQHYHLQHFAEYRLLDTNGAQVAVGNKVGFCLLDFYAWDANAAPGYLFDCDYQGIQRGWADVYMAGLPCQWVDITGLPGGTYILELEVDPQNLIAEADENNNISRVLVSIPNCAPPPNDDFDAAQAVSEPITTIAFDNRCASHEYLEPLHGGRGSSSIWFRWTAPGGGKLLLSTEGSPFDTLLAIYTGSMVSNLTWVAGDDDSGWYGTSRVMFNVTAGTRYNIAVDGYGGLASNGVLRVHYKPMVPPIFATPELLPPQQLRLTVNGGAADAYAIETVTGTNNAWAEWMRVTNRTGTVQLVDPAPTAPRKFYRARLLP
ncbi:MAG TPA: lysyl oxidase family protein [Verrucomicrobiae bacterium]|nr:lysyl oxidase family protein [Verrucomicrobiae bacterium]